MGKYDLSPLVLCPFYRHEDSHKIICETSSDFAGLHVVFSEPKQKLKYKAQFCNCFDYEKCTVARSLLAAWEELQDNMCP